MSDNQDGYTNLLLEQISQQNRAVLEAVSDMQQHVKLIPSMLSDIHDLKLDMKVVKAVCKDLSSLVNNHEVRITRLERT